MLRTDRFLVGIVAAMLLLVAAAFAVTLTRQPPSYRSGAEPADVAYNYVLALQRRDYARAHGSLSPTLRGYPTTAAVLAADVQRNGWILQPAAGTLQIDRTEMLDQDALVWLRTTSYQPGGLFSSSTSSSLHAFTLRHEAGSWKIVTADSYWLWCWDSEEGCR